MASRPFRRSCSLRVVLLAATLLVFAFLLQSTRLYATSAFVGALAAYQAWSLIALVETTNRVTNRFLSAVAASDYSESFTTGLSGKTFDELNVMFKDLMARFREVNLEKDAHSRYLRMIVHRLGVGLVTFDEGGRVELINDSARRLLGVRDVRNVSGFRWTDPELAARFASLRPGGRELVKVQRDHEVLQLSLQATQLHLHQRTMTLVTVQDIAGHLDEKEMEAWQNLIRVFTHEIKNSLTPIASLAATVEALVVPGGVGQGPSGDHAGDVAEALSTIRERSQGLLGFLDGYRDLTHVPQPELEVYPVADLLSRAEQLVAHRLREGDVALRVSIEPRNLKITADPGMIEQVLLNLLLNAVQALEGRTGGEIRVEARKDPRGRLVVRVTDNGPGIVESVRDRVFVPFFSTRSDGSGIGLCLSRQIMRKHRGDLTVRSDPERETSFIMRF